MEEHIISEKIKEYKELVAKKPISLLPNLLLLSYVALGNQYDKLLSYSEQFLMTNPKINLLVEDFIMLSSLATNQTSFADISFKNIHSIDPEEPYAHLMRLITETSADNFSEAKMFLNRMDLKELSIFLKDKEPSKPYIFYKIPDIIGLRDNLTSKIRKALEENPANPVLRASLAEVLLKTNQIKEAQKEIKTLLSIYPNYIRVLYLQAKLLQDYLEKEEKGIEIYKKIFELNPVSPYLRGMEIVFLNENDSLLITELKNIFINKNPFIAFFKECFKKKKGIDKENKKVQQKVEPIKGTTRIKQEENKITEVSPLEQGYKHLSKGNHKKAIESFLKDLKKK